MGELYIYNKIPLKDNINSDLGIVNSYKGVVDILIEFSKSFEINKVGHLVV